MSDTADADLKIDPSARFQSKVLKYNKMLAEIEIEPKPTDTRSDNGEMS